MKIKDSLLMSIPIVKRFWAKNYSPPFGPNFDILGQKQSLNVNFNDLNPQRFEPCMLLCVLLNCVLSVYRSDL